MIRARATDGEGRPVIVLGITPENLRRLQNDQAIVVSGESVGLPEFGAVVIMYGTVIELSAVLRGGMDADTVVKLETPLRDDGSPL